MKQLYVVLSVLSLNISTHYGQQLRPATSLSTSESLSLTRALPLHHHTESQVKTAICIDTLSYPFTKMSVLGAGQADLNTIDLETQYNDKLAQVYLNNGTLTITGAEIGVANKTTAGSPSGGINVLVEVYNVNTDNTPTALLGSQTVFINNTYPNIAFKRFAFSNPITVTGNYAIAVSTTTLGGILSCATSKQALNVSYHEGLARTYSSYQNINAWKMINEFWGDANGNPIDTEPMLHPIVSYSITAEGTIAPLTAPVNQAISFTNTSDLSVMNRMNSLGVFIKHWYGSPQDSTSIWRPNGVATNQIWAKNTSYAYPTAGTYSATLIVLSGFNTGCQDEKTFSVTITDNTPPPSPTCAISGLNTVCSEGSIILSSNGTNGVWTSSNVNVATVIGGIVTGVNVGTANISYGGSDNCTGTATILITVNDCGDINNDPQPITCSIVGEDSVCKGKTIELVASANGGTWSAFPSGIVSIENGTVTGLATGDVIISYNDGELCSNSPTHKISVTDCASNSSISGVYEFDAFSRVTILPNPTADRIFINGLPEKSTVIVSDLNGKILLVQHGVHLQAEILLENFVNGVYLVNIQSEEVNGVKKVVLNK